MAFLKVIPSNDIISGPLAESLVSKGDVSKPTFFHITNKLLSCTP